MVLVIMMTLPWSSHLIRILLFVHPSTHRLQSEFVYTIFTVVETCNFQHDFCICICICILCLFCVWSNLCSHFNIYIYENRIFLGWLPLLSITDPPPIAFNIWNSVELSKLTDLSTWQNFLSLVFYYHIHQHLSKILPVCDRFWTKFW